MSGVQMYRIKLGVNDGGSSTGEWRYYEEHERFAQDLLLFAIENARNSRGPDRDLARVFGAWRRLYRLPRKFLKHENYEVRDIFAVDRLVGDQWLPVKYRLSPPSITIQETA